MCMSALVPFFQMEPSCRSALYLSTTPVAQALGVLGPPLLRAKVAMMPTKSSPLYSQKPLGLPSSSPWYSKSSCIIWILGLIFQALMLSLAASKDNLVYSTQILMDMRLASVWS